MIRLALIAALLCCSACTIGSRSGLTPLFQQHGMRLNSIGVCLDDPRLLPVADLALVLLGQEAIAAGFPYEQTAAAIRSVPPGVCLVAAPEPCCAYGVCQHDTDGRVTDKAGCAIDGACWVSRDWPTAGQGRDWRGDLLHELSHVVAYALGVVPQQPNHKTAWAEVERRAMAAFLERYSHPP